MLVAGQHAFGTSCIKVINCLASFLLCSRAESGSINGATGQFKNRNLTERCIHSDELGIVQAGFPDKKLCFVASPLFDPIFGFYLLLAYLKAQQQERFSDFTPKCIVNNSGA